MVCHRRNTEEAFYSHAVLCNWHAEVLPFPCCLQSRILVGVIKELRYRQECAPVKPSPRAVSSASVISIVSRAALPEKEVEAMAGQARRLNKDFRNHSMS